MPIYIWRKKTPFSCRCSLKTAPLCPISQYFIVFHSMSVDEIPSYIPIISLLSSCFPFRKSPHITTGRYWTPGSGSPGLPGHVLCQRRQRHRTLGQSRVFAAPGGGGSWLSAGGCLIHLSILNIYIYYIFMYLYHIYIYVCVIYLLYTLMLVYHRASCCFLR